MNEVDHLLQLWYIHFMSYLLLIFCVLPVGYCSAGSIDIVNPPPLSIGTMDSLQLFVYVFKKAPEAYIYTSKLFVILIQNMFALIKVYYQDLFYWK